MQHNLPSNWKPGTSAASLTQAPQDWRLRAHTMFFALALVATLPRVIWASLSVVAKHYDVFSAAIGPFRVVALLATAVAIVLVAQLEFLDATPEGRAAAALRKLTFGALIFDAVWGLLQGVLLAPIGEFVPFDNVVVRVFAFSLLPAIADVVFALWLAQLLTTQKLTPVLPAVVAVSVAVSVVGSIVYWPRYAWELVNIGVIIATLVEVLRVRRALTEPG